MCVNDKKNELKINKNRVGIVTKNENHRTSFGQNMVHVVKGYRQDGDSSNPAPQYAMQCAW